MRLRSEENIVVFISLYDDEFRGIKCLNMLYYDWIWIGWLDVKYGGFRGELFWEKIEKFSSNSFDLNQGFNLFESDVKIL